MRWIGLWKCCSISLSPRQQPGRRIESEDFLGIPRIERKIEARPDPDVEHSAFGCARDALTIWTKSLVAHRQIDERRDNPFLIEAHRAPPVHRRDYPAALSRHSARRVGQVLPRESCFKHRGSHSRGHYRSTALILMAAFLEADLGSSRLDDHSSSASCGCTHPSSSSSRASRCASCHHGPTCRGSEERQNLVPPARAAPAIASKPMAAVEHRDGKLWSWFLM